MRSRSTRVRSRRKQAKGQILQALSRLCPGKGGNVSAIMNKAGEVVTDPQEMAEAQKEHLEDMFKSRLTDLKKMKKWLDEEKNKGMNSMHAKIAPTNDARWCIKPKHIKKALDLKNKL